MPRYLITHPRGQALEDILVEDEELTLTFAGGWAVFADANGTALAIPVTRDATIQRVDEAPDEDEHLGREEQLHVRPELLEDVREGLLELRPVEEGLLDLVPAGRVDDDEHEHAEDDDRADGRDQQAAPAAAAPEDA